MRVGVINGLADAPARRGVHVAAGGVVEAIEGSSRAYDTSVLLDPEGRELARYRRVHIHEAEAATLQAGSSLGITQTEFGAVGLTSGYDLHFPELYRSLALQGARVIFHTGADDPELLVRARAVENAVFMVSAGLIVDPWGAAVADIDLSGQAPQGKLADRRPAVYGPLANGLPTVPPTRPGDGRTLSYYERGATALFASRADQRFSHCLYVPSDYDEDGQTTYPLAVIVHGTTRTAQRYRDEFAVFGERHGCIVLAPLFPCGIGEPRDLDNYKRIRHGDIRFDLLLLDMVEEIGEKYRIEAERFLLHGFSGGGHFAHRFFYLHPQRLLGVSIGAPGMITLIDPAKPWWLGTQDLEAQFGVSLDLEEMWKVAVQMVIGGEDTDTWEINDRSSPGWMEGADAVGTTRLERLSALRDNYQRQGISVRYDIVPGVGHDGYRVLGPVRDFFGETLAGAREPT